MKHEADPRIQKAHDLLGGESFARLRRLLVQRIAKTGDIGIEVKLHNISSEERLSLERLLGCPGYFKAHATVRVAELEAIIVPHGFSDLGEVLECIEGSFFSRLRERKQAAEAWDAARNSALVQLANPFCDPEVIESAFRKGLVKRITEDDAKYCQELIAAAKRVFEELGAEEISIGAFQTRRSRAELAARLFGDSHALDSNEPLVRFLRQICGREEESDAGFWQTLGVSCLATTSSALLLNVRFLSGLCAKSANACADIGEPYRLTLRSLRDNPMPADVDEVMVCENPAVLEAGADMWKLNCRPMICTEGQPSAACRKVLRLLDDTGVQLHYHGDFDWGGTRIANGLFREFHRMVPWRYNTVEYERLNQNFTNSFPLHGRPVKTEWDMQLGERMEQVGRGYHEEVILHELLDELK